MVPNCEGFPGLLGRTSVRSAVFSVRDPVAVGPPVRNGESDQPSRSSLLASVSMVLKRNGNYSGA